MSARVSKFESGKYEKGSIKQRIFEPLAGAKTLANGTLYYEVSEKEISRKIDETALRIFFNKVKDMEQIDAEDESEIHAAMYD